MQLLLVTIWGYERFSSNPPGGDFQLLADRQAGDL